MQVQTDEKRLPPHICDEAQENRRILVVDDSRSQRRILLAYLSRWGFDVLEAASGEEALEICASEEIDLILSDWMMPGLNGLELCARYRELLGDRYGYFILLTSKSEKGEVAHGLDMGADDFLTKPVSALELRARIRAGERILKMERELTRKNLLIGETLSEISTLYDALDRDLIEAQNLQKSLVRESFRDFGQAQVSLLLRPSGHVGGDLVGYYEISPTRFGVFAIDVSGHGVASAMLTARVAAYLSGRSPDQNLALAYGPDGEVVARSPAQVARKIDRMFHDEMETELYFTMILGHIDTVTGQGEFVQCGHPNMVIQRVDGLVETVGSGGFPIGLVPDAEWENFQIQIAPGDRVLLASDGITECPGASGDMLDDAGLAELMQRNRDLKGEAFFETLLWDLTTYCGDKGFPDDISAVLIECACGTKA